MNQIRVAAICLLASCLPGAAIVDRAHAQAAYEVMPTEEIPHDYESWSLFLICNPAWIVANQDQGVADLFRQYRAFGDAIGPRNLAIWFWKEPAFEPSAELTDVSRSSEYCERFELLPSQSPYVLVTTRHPDEPETGDRFVVSLDGLAPAASAEVLAKLTDQLLVTGLDQAGLDASARWQRTLTAVVAVVSELGTYFDRVSFTFDTGFFKAEIAHTSE